MTNTKKLPCNHRMTFEEEQQAQKILQNLSQEKIPELDDLELNMHLDSIKLNERQKNAFEHLAFKNYLILDLNKTRRNFGFTEYKVSSMNTILPSLFDLFYLMQLKDSLPLKNGISKTFP